MNSKSIYLKNVLRFVIDNSVTILFSIICIIGIIASKEQPFMLVSLLLERMTRNTFLVLALLIPVVAGMGLNFSITIGAMAAQIAIIAVAYWQIPTGWGVLGAFVISAPIALILGFFIGKLLNKTRGQEMIASMITGFFADGIYQLIFLFLAGTLIPMTGEFVLSHGVGLRNTIDLMKGDGSGNGIGKAMDKVISVPFFTVLIIFGLIVLCYHVGLILVNKMKKESLQNTIKKVSVIAGTINLVLLLTSLVVVIFDGKMINFKLFSFEKVLFEELIIKAGTFDFVDYLLIGIYITAAVTAFGFGYLSKRKLSLARLVQAGIFAAAGLALTIYSYRVIYGADLSHDMKMLKTVKMSVFTATIVILFALFNVVILKTKLGQTFKTVGQDKHIAEVSGIKVNKIRVLAIMLSTLFAAWGQIIFIQNLGILNTYGSHKQIALFAVAALLIGGASVSKATIGQAFLGVLLFHTLFIVSPKAGLNLFNDAQLGEFFRTFVAYGVIGVSLGLHAWKTQMMRKNE
jgi:simple sugar transport system permease protein